MKLFKKQEPLSQSQVFLVLQRLLFSDNYLYSCI